MAPARIGFMQGRLSPQVDGKIQAFPWKHWREEFAAAQAAGFDLMEWTLDAERLPENPFMTEPGQAEIRALQARYRLEIQSLTGDFFMQAPFHKVGGAERESRLRDLRVVSHACSRLGVRYLVIPLVDAGRIETPQQEADVLHVFRELALELKRLAVSVAFESDYPPDRLAQFIEQLPAGFFGVNYDIGNSASFGFDPRQEIAAYGRRVVNVHVKDRQLGGSTVPLGTGNADFAAVFGALRRVGYAGNFILQPARAADGDHAGALKRYRQMTEHWLAGAVHAA